MSHRVYICTAVFNDLEHTKQLIASIRQQTYKKSTTIILDDASTDDTLSYLRKHHPEIVALPSQGNNWWTGGLNLSIAHALTLARPGDFILTINNDCTFDENYLATITQSSLSAGRAIIGSVELDIHTKKLKTGLIHMDWQSGKWYNNRHLKKIANAQYHNTKGTLFPVEVFASVGLLDQKRLPHYASDIEFTHRAVVAGYQLLIDPGCRVYCDQKRTGLIPSDNNSLKHLLSLAFSRKSTINLVDHFYLISLTCPNHLKLRNYLRLIGKVIYLGKKAIWH